MIVCVCNNVKEDEIIDMVEQHEIKEIEELQAKISVCNQCCMCKCYINDLINLLQDSPLQQDAA